MAALLWLHCVDPPSKTVVSAMVTKFRHTTLCIGDVKVPLLHLHVLTVFFLVCVSNLIKFYAGYSLDIVVLTVLIQRSHKQNFIN